MTWALVTNSSQSSFYQVLLLYEASEWEKSTTRLWFYDCATYRKRRRLRKGESFAAPHHFFMATFWHNATAAAFRYGSSALLLSTETGLRRRSNPPRTRTKVATSSTGLLSTKMCVEEKRLLFVFTPQGATDRTTAHTFWHIGRILSGGDETSCHQKSLKVRPTFDISRAMYYQPICKQGFFGTFSARPNKYLSENLS